MSLIHQSRIARTARFLAARLEKERTVILTVRTAHADNKVFRIFHYMNRYCGKYSLGEDIDPRRYILRKTWG